MLIQKRFSVAVSVLALLAAVSIPVVEAGEVTLDSDENLRIVGNYDNDNSSKLYEGVIIASNGELGNGTGLRTDLSEAYIVVKANLNNPGATYGGFVDVYADYVTVMGDSSINLNAVGGASELAITNGAVAVTGTLSSTANTTLGTNSGTTNTIGNAGTSTNTIQGSSNTLSGTTAVNGNFSANAAGGATELSVTGGTVAVTGALSATSNSTLGTNSGTTNTFGSGANSTNTIGNAGTSANTMTGATSTVAGTTSASVTGSNASLNLGSNTAAMGVASGSTITATNTALSALASDGSGLSVASTGAISLLNELGATDAGLIISANGDNVSLLNDVGGGHGLTITGTATTLTGGTNSSTLLLEDAQAKLSVGTAGSTETDAIIVTGAPFAGTTLTTVNIGGTSNTQNNLLATATNGVNNITANTVNGVNNITAATNNLIGTTNINVSNNFATNIATGTTTQAVTIGNAANTTSINSATTNIGVGNLVSGNTSINIGTTSGAQTSAVAIGNVNAGTTVTGTAGATSLALADSGSILRTIGAASGGSNLGGVVATDATSASLRASNGGTLASNGTTGTMVVGNGGGFSTYATSQNTGIGTTIGGVADNKDYTNKISGNLFVDGNVYINGTLDYVSSNSANTSVIGIGTGTSILEQATQGTSAGTAIVVKDAEGTYTAVDANGKLTNVTGVADQSTASLTLTNGVGNTHGFHVSETAATMSGGINSTSLTLSDSGARFSNAETGAPVTVTGVADGRSDFDAVNYRQLKLVAGGVASTAAMANIPMVDQNKTFALGLGVGNFMDETAIAAGVSYRFMQNAVVKASFGSGLSGGSKSTVGGGLGWSF